MARQLGDIDEFLSYKGSERGGGGGAYLRKWKENVPPRVDTWMHLAQKPWALWQHSFPTVVSYEKEGTTYVRTFTKPHNCLEDEKVLQNQHRRERGSNVRLFPPKVCPVDLLAEWVRAELVERRLPVWTPLFEVSAADDPEPTLVTCGGFVGLINDKFLSPDELKDAKKHGCSPKEAWKEKGLAKLNYLFLVVDNANPAAGVQKAIETGLLGEKVQEVVAAEIESAQCAADPKGLKGNPWINPYAIRWTHVPGEDVPFNAKYKANAMRNLEMSEQVRELISGDPPDVSKDVAPLNVASLRSAMERYCVLKGVPWDDLFFAEQSSGDPDEPRQERPAPRASAQVPARVEALAAKPGVAIVQCGMAIEGGGECDATFPEDFEGACPKCGGGGEEPEPLPPPPPPMKRRAASPATTGRQLGGPKPKF